MILTGGEALMDVFVEPGDGLRRAASFAMGGSPFNLAIALARQGLDVSFFGGLSDDAFGALLRAALQREGVDDRLAPTVPYKTTLSIVSRDAQGEPRYDFRGDQGAELMIGAESVPAMLPASCRVVALSSYPLVLEPVRHAMLRLARLAAPDRMISLDLNYRPSLVGDRRIWAERFAPYESLVTLMKASEEDIHLAYGGTRSPDAAAQHWLSQGAALVLITRGAAGASLFTRDHDLHVEAPSMPVCDTVGAGDCFHAGFLAALAHRQALTREAVLSLTVDELRACLRWAVMTASISVTRQGADPPTTAAIEAHLQEFVRV